MNSSLNATLLSTVSLQIILSVSLMSQKEERLLERVWTKRRKKHLRGPFCHLIWIFCQTFGEFSQKFTFFVKFFLAIFVRIVTFKGALFAVSFEFSPFSPFLLYACTHLHTYPAPPYVVSLAQKGYPSSWLLFWYRHGMSSHDILVAYFVMFHPGV